MKKKSFKELKVYKLKNLKTLKGGNGDPPKLRTEHIVEKPPG